MKVARSAEAQPEETDPAKASSENLRLLGQNHPSSQRSTLQHWFVPADVNWAILVCILMCWGNLTQIQKCMDEADIGGLRTDAGTQALSW